MIIIIKHISRKIEKNIGIKSRLAYLLIASILLTLYYSLIYPYLTYCNMIWASNYTSPLYRTIVLQKKRIVHITMRLPYNSHTSQAFAQLEILKAPQITKIQIGEFMHRFTYTTLANAFANYFNRASVFDSYHKRNFIQYRSEFSHTNTRIFGILCHQNCRPIPLE